jgi:hypothetical protein
MWARKKLKPGQDGTKSLLDKYGDQLLCVRYRYDEQQHLRHTTVELIVEMTKWQPPTVAADHVVGVRIGLSEVELQRKVRQAGGRWNRERQLWELRYDQALSVGLKARIEATTLPNTRQGRMPTIRQKKMPNSRWKCILLGRNA